MGTDRIKDRDNWNFNKYDDYVLRDKKFLIDYHIGMALEKTLKMFKYDNLPDTLPQREVERILQLYGFIYIKKVKGKLYGFYGGLGGIPDEYYRPTKMIIANPYLKYFDTLEVDEEGVLIWNDLSHMGMYPMLRRYAEFMAECDITLRFGLINSRIISVLEALDDKAKTQAEAFLKDIEDGKKIGVIVGKSFESEDGTLRVNEYRKANSQDIKDVMELQQYIKASFYNEIGLQANFNMKREAINESESSMNEEALKPYPDNMLQCRTEGWDKVNAMYETNIKVDYSSSWVARKELGEENKVEEEQKSEETVTEVEEKKEGDSE